MFFLWEKKINCLSKDQSWRIIITTLYDRVTNERQIKTAIYTEDTLKEKSQGKTVPYNEREDFLWQMSKQDKSPFCRWKILQSPGYVFLNSTVIYLETKCPTKWWEGKSHHLENFTRPSYNSPFPRYLKPFYQSEAWCRTIHVKMSLISTWMKFRFHVKGWALALRKRLNVIRK